MAKAALSAVRVASGKARAGVSRWRRRRVAAVDAAVLDVPLHCAPPWPVMLAGLLASVHAAVDLAVVEAPVVVGVAPVWTSSVSCVAFAAGWVWHVSASSTSPLRRRRAALTAAAVVALGCSAMLVLPAVTVLGAAATAAAEEVVFRVVGPVWTFVLLARARLPGRFSYVRWLPVALRFGFTHRTAVRSTVWLWAVLFVAAPGHRSQLAELTLPEAAAAAVTLVAFSVLMTLLVWRAGSLTTAVALHALFNVGVYGQAATPGSQLPTVLTAVAAVAVIKVCAVEDRRWWWSPAGAKLPSRLLDPLWTSR